MKSYQKIIIIVVVILTLVIAGYLLLERSRYLSREDVKNIILGNMNVASDDVFFDSIDLERDNNCYEVELYYNNNEYDYKVDAESGKIIYTNFYAKPSDDELTIPSSNISDSSTQSTTTTENRNDIGVDEAMRIALEDANLKESDVRIIKKERERDDGRYEYDIEFVYNEYEYDYKIDSETGNIIDFSREHIYD